MWHLMGKKTLMTQMVRYCVCDKYIKQTAQANRRLRLPKMKCFHKLWGTPNSGGRSRESEGTIHSIHTAKLLILSILHMGVYYMDGEWWYLHYCNLTFWIYITKPFGNAENEAVGQNSGLLAKYEIWYNGTLPQMSRLWHAPERSTESTIAPMDTSGKTLESITRGSCD